MDGSFLFHFLFTYIYSVFFFACTRYTCIYCYILYNVQIILDSYATT